MLIAILLVIIVIGIMNSMWMSVRERTQEIGTLRAIGMSRGRVLGMFMAEALLLGLGATTIGALIGAAIALTLDAMAIRVPVDAVKAILMSETLHMAVAPPQLVTAVLVFTTITVLAALIPAMRAARMQPVTAIQSTT
jgi:putative ABC transport system permease protein